MHAGESLLSTVLLVNFACMVWKQKSTTMDVYAYTRCKLLSYSKVPGRINTIDWQRLCRLGLIAPNYRPTIRGRRAGTSKSRQIETIINPGSRRLRSGRPNYLCREANLITIETLNTIPVLISRDRLNEPSIPGQRAHGENLSSIKIKSHVPEHLNCVLLNARSVCNKTLTISEHVLDKKADIMFITETWLKPNDTAIIAEMTPPGYTYLGINRSGRGGGGLGVLYNKFLDLTLATAPTKFSSFEYLEVNLRVPAPVCMVLVYRPPSKSRAIFVDEFEDLVTTLSSKPQKILIAGDFNLHFENRSAQGTAPFCDILDASGLNQHVATATHKAGHILDLLLSRDGDSLVSAVEVLQSDISDHKSICFQLNIPPQEQACLHTTTRHIRKIDRETFMQDLRDRFAALPHEGTVDELLASYTDAIKLTLDEHAPLKSRKVLGRKCPWFTEEVHAARQAKKQAERKWRTTELEIHRQMYAEKRTLLNQCITKAKSDYYNDQLTGADQKTVFQCLNSLLKVQTAPLHQNDDSDTLSQEFASFFCTKISTIRKNIADCVDSEQLTTPPTKPRTPPPILSELTPTSVEELMRLIKKSPGKSCELDCIPTSLLKETMDVHLPVLTKVINASFSAGCFPSQLKTAIVRPLLKNSSLDKADLRNYRPVSNLAYFGKLVEKVAVSRLIDHARAHDLEEQYQSAYKPHHCTETALIKVHDDLGNALDQGRGALVLFLDMSAAFDTVDIPILLDTLTEHVGVRGAALSWFRTYLSGRTQCVKIGSSTSSETSLQFGVPQGSVLGPVLFSVYTQPLREIFSRYPRVHYHKYADDITIYCVYDPAVPGDLAQAKSLLAACYREIRAWLLTRFLQLNDVKTDFLCVLSRHQLSKYGREATVLGDVVVVPADAVKTLGAKLDIHLSMTCQVNSVISTCNFYLRQLGRIRKNITEQACHSAVQALIISRLDYCNVLLAGLPATQIHRLQKIHNQAARLIKRAGKLCHITPLLLELHWLPVHQRVKYKTLMYVFKALHDMAPSYIRDLLQIHRPARNLRSSNNGIILQEPPTSRAIGERTFSRVAPRLWNELPLKIRSAESKTCFKSRLKTFLFLQYFGH